METGTGEMGKKGRGLGKGEIENGKWEMKKREGKERGNQKGRG